MELSVELLHERREALKAATAQETRDDSAALDLLNLLAKTPVSEKDLRETKVGVLVGAVTKSGFTEDIKNAAKEVVKRWKSVVSKPSPAVQSKLAEAKIARSSSAGAALSSPPPAAAAAVAMSESKAASFIPLPKLSPSSGAAAISLLPATSSAAAPRAAAVVSPLPRSASAFAGSGSGAGSGFAGSAIAAQTFNELEDASTEHGVMPRRRAMPSVDPLDFDSSLADVHDDDAAESGSGSGAAAPPLTSSKSTPTAGGAGAGAGSVHPGTAAAAMQRSQSAGTGAGAGVSSKSQAVLDAEDRAEAAAILNKTRDPVRDKIQCLLYEAIDKSGGLRQAQLAIQIEDSMHRAFGHTGKEYKSKFRDVVFHLKDPRNMELNQDLIDGMLTPDDLVHKSAMELASDEMKKQRAADRQWMKDAARSDWNREKGATDMFKCGKCKQRKTTYTQRQTRSADEPMTTFVHCVVCGNRWRC